MKFFKKVDKLILNFTQLAWFECATNEQAPDLNRGWPTFTACLIGHVAIETSYFDSGTFSNLGLLRIAVMYS